MKISKSKLLKKAAFGLLSFLLCSIFVFGSYAKYSLNVTNKDAFVGNAYAEYSITYKNFINSADRHFYGALDGTHGDKSFDMRNANDDGEWKKYGENTFDLPYIWDVRNSLSADQKLDGGTLIGWSEFMPGEQKQSNLIGEQYHILEGGGADGQGTKNRTLYTVWQKELDLQSKLNLSSNLAYSQHVVTGTSLSNYTLGVPGNHTSNSNRQAYRTINAETFDATKYNFFEFDLYIPEGKAQDLEALVNFFPGAFHVYLGSPGANLDNNNYKARWNIASLATSLKVGYNHIVIPLSELDFLAGEKITPVDLTKVNFVNFEIDVSWGDWDGNGKYTAYGESTDVSPNSPTVTGCVISGIKFTTVANDAPDSIGEATYATRTDAINGIEAKQAVHYIEYGEIAVHSAKIPAGGTYYRGVTSNIPGDYAGYKQKLEEGQYIGPDGSNAITPQNGDVYVYGDYEYRYNRSATTDHKWNATYNNQGGWGVILLNRSKVSYGSVLWEIADKPVNMLNFAFGNADNMSHAPEVPPSVTSMYRAFNHCDELLTAPKIPEGVTSTHGCFSDCYELREPSNIPSTVSGTDGMSYMFYDCGSMLYAPRSFPTNSSVTSMDRMFWNCQSIKEYPSIPEQITNMHSTFANNLVLETAPNIPENVVNMHSTFSRCEKITTVGAIPQGVVDLGSTFYRCMNLHGNITINATNLQSWSGAFELAGCSFTYDKWTGEIDYNKGVTKTHLNDPIKIVGSSSNDIKQKLASTNSYGTVTY